ncbi:unnamed protein product, partial [marine sediment metagenome]
KPVYKLEDIKGLQLRSPGGVVTRVVKSWGGTPVSMPMSEAYIALEKGIVDGTLFPYDVMRLAKLGELTKYTTEGNFCTNPLFLVMNLHTYQSLPPDIKKIIDDTSYEWWVNAGKLNDRLEVVARKWMLDRGNEIIKLSPEELKIWKQADTSVINKWASDLEAKGLPGRKFVDMALQCAKEYGK